MSDYRNDALIQGYDDRISPQAIDLMKLGEGDVAYVRARRKDDGDLDGDWPYLVFTASGELWAGADTEDQAHGFILENGMTPIAPS